MPKPKPSETQAQFIERCIPIVLEEGTADDANQAYAVCLSMWEDEKMEKYVEISKKDKKNQVVKGVVYEALDVDTDRDTAVSEELQKACWKFLANRLEKNIDLNHDWKQSGSYVCESYFTGEEAHGDFPPNAWVVAVKCDDKMWKKVENGDVNGFSFGGSVNKFAQRVLLEVAKEIVGETEENANKDIIPPHIHSFLIHFNKEGNIIKGITNTVQDHSHEIKYGTSTEISVGHSHRVSLD